MSEPLTCRPRLAGLDQFATLAQKDQPLLVVDADQDQAAGGIQHQGLDHLQTTLAARGLKTGHQLGRVAANRPGGQADQAQGEGQAEDGAKKVEEIHQDGPAPKPQVVRRAGASLNRQG